ncbi:hypothetical protein RSAG8_10893, partial [Rhizoctonia solani AG-8 WAC10335]
MCLSPSLCRACIDESLPPVHRLPLSIFYSQNPESQSSLRVLLCGAIPGPRAPVAVLRHSTGMRWPSCSWMISHALPESSYTRGFGCGSEDLSPFQ